MNPPAFSSLWYVWSNNLDSHHFFEVYKVDGNLSQSYVKWSPLTDFIERSPPSSITEKRMKKNFNRYQKTRTVYIREGIILLSPPYLDPFLRLL